MSHFSEMEWNNNSKWDWENLVSFGSKPTENPKKLQQADWMVVDDGEINPGTCNLSRFGGYNSCGASGSDGGHNSSAKSSISASTDSSTRDFRFNVFKGFSGKLSNKVEYSVNSPSLQTSSPVSMEPLIGLKLGKRTYFENNATFNVMPTPTSTTLKKNKPTGQNVSIFCQVEGCNMDLLGAKDYHRKHRVCDSHSKFPKVIIGGQERRFCQQCSRFHSLCEFDEKKRSCRRRLSDHNARRRKPQQETIQFKSTRTLSSPFYGGTQQMSFMLNNSPPIHNPRTPANPVWDRVSNPKFTLAKGYPLKSDGGASTDGGQLYTSRSKFPHDINAQNGANGLLPTKYSTFEVFNPGSKRSLISPPLDEAPDRALSLLSSNSWDSCEPEPIPSHNLMHQSNSNITQSMIHATPEGAPLSSTEFWLSGQQSMHPNIHSLAGSTNFQEFQLFKTPYEPDFYSSILN